MPISLFFVLSACEQGNSDVRPADFSVRPGVESVTVVDAEPGAPLTLYDGDGTALVTLIADDLGQAHFAYIPAEHQVLDPSNFEGLTLADGHVVWPGEGYTIQDDTTTPPNWSGEFRVLAVDDVPHPAFYDVQKLVGIHSSPITGDATDPEEGYQYIQMRDGALLGAMVRFPDKFVYGDGPYLTVIEYSGYSPSRPDRMDPGTRIANALGYATVSVNMRGSGCSGGVFDVFNRAQHADGYDLAEIVARQDWVLNNQVGMVGLSYPGISQLYVASTNPPSLAGVVPLSTIGDAWEMQWPGGIYNEGFTRNWVNAREDQSKLGGASWVTKRIEDGDTICADNLKLSDHSVDFETFLRAMDVRPDDANARDLNRLVSQIEAPVFYGGSFQDEQTGAQFGRMLDRFDSTEMLKVRLSNGRHVDGYSPDGVYRFFEFLEFYVGERIPAMNPLVRSLGASEFGGSFGMNEAAFEDDRFGTYDSYAAALAAYESEPAVQLSFESGAGQEQPGTPVARFETLLDSWPPKNAGTQTWFMAPNGMLESTAPSEAGADTWTFDADAGAEDFFGEKGYQTMPPLWDIDWTRFEEGYIASYLTEPLTDDVILAGPGRVELWVNSPVDDVTAQVTLTEVRSDGTEVYIQSGWLRFAHRAYTEDSELRIVRTFSEADLQDVPPDEWISGMVPIPSFAHPMRAGSSLRVSVTSPGRDHGTWAFENPDYTGTPTFSLGIGADVASSIILATLPGVEIPAEYPPCPSLRGQPCRDYVPTANVAAD